MTARRQVVDGIGPLVRHPRHDRVVVGDVECARAVEIELDDLVAPCREMHGEVATDEPAGSGDGRSHAPASR